ncbi:uncharacterized protein N7511_002764 [Penicillium nucicola]|uniref:uncharacterized protein n=1 Tax=Penicillium nucicola TaxID=1850975 RepID=UPI0025452EC3|nr:uncharacterized protein N7511_002764 [Penicillium nucicola]KAJ5770713.1 hypothetical protein N7511_002764 [Penicillium nucicola]
MPNPVTIYPKAMSARMNHTSILLNKQTSYPRLDAVYPRSILHRVPYSTGGYGDQGGSGDPEGKNPASLGVNRRTREIEHPGPSPPDTSLAKSKSSSPSKDGNKKRIPRSPKEEHGNKTR